MENAQETENRKWITTSLKYGVSTAIVYSLCCFYIILWAVLDSPLVVPLGLILVFKLLIIPKSFQDAKTYNSEKLILIDSILKILFIVMLIPASYHHIKLIHAGIPLYVSCIYLTLISYKNPSNYAVCLHILKIIIQWCCSVSFICLSLRFDKVINWSWLYLIWPLWLLITLASISAFFYIVFILVLWLKEKVNILCPLWFFATIFGTSISLSLFFIGFSYYLDEKSSSVLIMGSIILGGFLLVFGISIVILYKKIVEWVINIFSPNPEPQESNQQNQPSSIKKQLKSFNSSLFLSRISSTFYKTVKRKPKKEAEKNESNNSVKECLICCSNSTDGVIMPCGHSGICYNCGLKLFEDGKDCHICRKKIKSLLKVDKGESKVIIATEVENE